MHLTTKLVKISLNIKDLCFGEKNFRENNFQSRTSVWNQNTISVHQEISYHDKYIINTINTEKNFSLNKSIFWRLEYDDNYFKHSHVSEKGWIIF